MIQEAIHTDLFRLIAPECLTVITALIILAVSFRRKTTQYSSGPLYGVIGMIGLALAFLVSLFYQSTGFSLGSAFIVTDATRWVKAGLLLMGFLIFWQHTASPSHIGNQGEFHALMLFAIAGMSLLIGADHLLMIFVALEITALSLYILAAIDKTNTLATRVALKYFLIGGLSAAFVLYGFSLIFGVAGTMRLSGIAEHCQTNGNDPLLMMGILMALVGFGFKVAAAPFHWWVADVYTSTLTPVTCLIASTSKVAGFFVMGRFLWHGLIGAQGSLDGWEWTQGWIPWIAMLAVLSMLVGNLAALRQTKLRRLIGFSAVAHTGYALLGLCSPTPQASASIAFYMLTYGLSVIGLLSLLELTQGNQKDAEHRQLEGLWRRAPWLAACLMLLVLSLAGIPPLVGFIAKFNLFIAALNTPHQTLGLIGLVVLALGASAVSLYYYLGVLKAAFCLDQPDEAMELKPSTSQYGLVFTCTLLTLLFGVFPGWLLTRFLEAFSGA